VGNLHAWGAHRNADCCISVREVCKNYPKNLAIETNRAHAMMFLGREEEAKVLYLGYKGKRVPEQDNETWDQVVDEDFAEFGKIGLNNPLIAKIEKELDVGR
jgi:hypothetical protein